MISQPEPRPRDHGAGRCRAQALEEISIRRRLEEPTLSGVGLAFDHARVSKDAEELVAIGSAQPWRRRQAMTAALSQALSLLTSQIKETA